MESETRAGREREAEQDTIVLEIGKCDGT